MAYEGNRWESGSAPTIVLRETVKEVKKVEVLIIHESVWKSVVSDSYSALTLIGSAIAGWYFSSLLVTLIPIAMIALVSILRFNKKKTLGSCSIEQARDRLDQLEEEFLKGRPPIEINKSNNA